MIGYSINLIFNKASKCPCITKLVSYYEKNIKTLIVIALLMPAKTL